MPITPTAAIAADSQPVRPGPFGERAAERIGQGGDLFQARAMASTRASVSTAGRRKRRPPENLAIPGIFLDDLGVAARKAAAAA